jgi:hypothetical protein
MRTTKTFMAGAVLTLVFAFPVFAGDIHTTVTSPPPPPSPITTESHMDTSSVAGEISTPAPASDSMIEVALSLVQGVLALF